MVRRAGKRQGVGSDLRRPRRPATGAVGPLGDLQDSGYGHPLAGRRAAKAAAEEPAGALQGSNSWPAAEAIGYRGPMPPPGHGVHHYYFKLYALDSPIEAEPGLDKTVLLDKFQGHVVAEGVLMGTYERKR